MKSIKDPILKSVIHDARDIISRKQTAYKRESDSKVICQFLPLILEYCKLFKQYYLKIVYLNDYGIPIRKGLFFDNKDDAENYIFSYDTTKITDKDEIIKACVYFWNAKDEEF